MKRNTTDTKTIFDRFDEEISPLGFLGAGIRVYEAVIGTSVKIIYRTAGFARDAWDFAIGNHLDYMTRRGGRDPTKDNK